MYGSIIGIKPAQRPGKEVEERGGSFKTFRGKGRNKQTLCPLSQYPASFLTARKTDFGIHRPINV